MADTIAQDIFQPSLSPGQPNGKEPSTPSLSFENKATATFDDVVTQSIVQKSFSDPPSILTCRLYDDDVVMSALQRAIKMFRSKINA